MAGGGVAVLATVLGVAVALQATGAPACAAALPPAALPPVAVPAAVPTGTAVHSGIATYYTGLAAGGNLGNCSFPAPPADNLYVALSPPEYAAAGACGGYLDVTGSRGAVRVKVVDQCPECAVGHLDLSRQAFARIDDPAKGQVPVRYAGVVNPSVAASITVVVKTGSSRYWLGVLVSDQGNPLSSVQVKVGSGWSVLSRQSYNYWLAAGGAGPGPFTLRLRDVYGQQATLTGIVLSPGLVQRTGVHLYAAGAGAPAAPAPRTATRPSGVRPASVPAPPSGTASASAAVALAVRPTGRPCH